MAGRSTVYAPRGVIATSQPLASAAGLEVLQRGGNAIDAAVTAAAVLAVVEPHMTGMGGDLFAMVWSAKDKNLHGLNASGRSGSLMTRETLAVARSGRASRQGVEVDHGAGRAVRLGRAAREASARCRSRRRWRRRFASPTKGFPVTPIIADDWADEVDSAAARSRARRATFLLDGTRAPKAGEWFRNPDLAADDARDRGQRPEASVRRRARPEDRRARVQKLGGFLTPEDFAAHKADWVQPVSVPYKGYRLWELPPNSQGIAALEMLRMLEPYDLKAMGHNSAAVSASPDRSEEARVRGHRVLRRRPGHDEAAGRSSSCPTSTSRRAAR